MSAVPQAGGAFLYHGKLVNSRKDTVEVCGVDIDVEFVIEGGCAIVVAAQIGREDCWPLLDGTKIGQEIEAILDRRVQS